MNITEDQSDLERLIEERTAELARSNQALAVERQLLRTVIDLLPDYIYVKDRQSRFLVNNIAVAKNLNLTPEEVNGKTDFDFFPRDLAEQFFADEQQVIATGQPLISREEPNYYPVSNSWGWHLTTTVPLRDGKGEIVGIVGVSRDITAHKKAEEALRERIVQQKFTRQLIDSQESERKRIAAELHDGLGQSLLVVKNKLLLALRFLSGKQDPSAEINEAIGIVSQTLQDVRDISHNLRPHHIDELGLTKSIESMIRRLAQSTGLEFTTTIDWVDDALSPEAEINLYRIAQESFNNIVKHSKAQHITVDIQRATDTVRLTIKDDGQGFDADTRTKGTGREETFGLMIMSERARMFGGDLTVNSEPGKGTIISVTLPIHRRPDGA